MLWLSLLEMPRPGAFPHASQTTRHDLAESVTSDIIIFKRYCLAVITGFRDADTELLWNTGTSRRIPASIRRSAARKLALLNAALELANLFVPPGNRLEASPATERGSTAFASTTNTGLASYGKPATHER